MISNGHIIALNDDAVEVGDPIECHYNLQTMQRGFVVGQDGKTLYFDAKVMIGQKGFDYDGLSVYDLDGNFVGRFVVGSRRYNQFTQIYEMMCYRY